MLWQRCFVVVNLSPNVFDFFCKNYNNVMGISHFKNIIPVYYVRYRIHVTSEINNDELRLLNNNNNNMSFQPAERQNDMTN